MSYNLKNKNTAILALSLVTMMIMSGVGQAQDAAPALFEEIAETEIMPQISTEETIPAVTAENVSENSEANGVIAVDTSFLDEQSADNNIPEISEVDEEANNLLSPETDEFLADATAVDDENGNIQDEQDKAVVAPSSPFENFGNAILSKVDNDLFNQMSQIEKQTTLLNLELKREDVRNKIEALRAARMLARQEAEARRIEEEQKLKDMEMARQVKLLEAQKKLQEKQIELEKVRQAKVLNDYMNEMLQAKQKWIEKNAISQKRINELKEERKGLIAAFEEKIESVRQKVNSLNVHATEAVEKYTTTLKTLNAQIIQLRKEIVDSETRLQLMREQASGNPFAQSNLDPNAASTDLAQEYAIMDITGQGDDIVAKIVSRDGTTFTIHRGSVLRGGETVLKITEKYIAFDKKGIKAYLYPGGTVMEYEPKNVFNEAEKTPEKTEKQSIRPEKISTDQDASAEPVKEAPVFGKPISSERKNTKNNEDKQEKPRQTKSLSFSQGMFAY